MSGHYCGLVISTLILASAMLLVEDWESVSSVSDSTVEQVHLQMQEYGKAGYCEDDDSGKANQKPRLLVVLFGTFGKAG